ncbi:MAG: hypothetical protein MHPSP_004011 [Paramarteilia canceri]
MSESKVKTIVSNYSNLIQHNLEWLTIKELKEKLIRYNLAVKGNKKNMVCRMVNHFEMKAYMQLHQILKNDFAMSNSSGSEYGFDTVSLKSTVSSTSCPYL